MQKVVGSNPISRLPRLPAPRPRRPGRLRGAFSFRGPSLGSQQPGALAEWLRSGLQSRLHRFDSGRRLFSVPHYFRSAGADEKPADLLEPENQISTPWGDSDHGACEKCSGEGRVSHRCLSCLERDAPDPGCPSCAGRVRWEGACPSCEGTGTIDRTERHGVSVFPTEKGLYRYLLERDAELDGCTLVELEGKRSDDVDLDADVGALLVLPSQIVDQRPIDGRLVEEVRSHLV
jgi:hypothetical protein